MLARELTSFEIERIAVAVAGWVAEHRDMRVLFKPAHLHVVGNVAPDQITADTVPGRALGPECAGMEPPNHSIVDDVTPEAIVERHDVRVRVLHRLPP